MWTKQRVGCRIERLRFRLSTKWGNGPRKIGGDALQDSWSENRPLRNTEGFVAVSTEFVLQRRIGLVRPGPAKNSARTPRERP
jgi:hypothetical protein